MIWVNDANYTVKLQKEFSKTGVNRNRELVWWCPYHKTWSSMRDRVNNVKLRSTVCDEWRNLSNFKNWMEDQPYLNMSLDKDLLFYDNRHYSPNTCLFIPTRVNCMFSNSSTIRGSYPLGVSYRERYVNKFAAHIKINNVQKRLGCFNNSLTAHKAWQEAKIKAIEEVIEWWATDYLVKHSFSAKAEYALLRKIKMLRNDIDKNKETVKL